MTFYAQIDANKRKTWTVIFAFLLFVVGLGYLFDQTGGGGLSLTPLAVSFSLFSAFFSFYFSDKVILKLAGAREASRQTYPLFYDAVQNLSLGAGLPMPKLYVIEDSAPNAFATGRDPQHSVICATTGLLQKLNRTELEGVIAHELSHIRNFDIRLMSVVVVLVGTVVLLSDWFLRWGFSSRGRSERRGSGALVFLSLLAALLAPLIAMLIQLAISRRREFLADASAISLTRQPQGLISALQKISADREPLEVANKATAHLYIVNPFKNTKGEAVDFLSGLFNTHPPISERVAALRQM